MTAEQTLRIHMDIFNRALKEQDYAALEGLYASDYMLVRPDGSVLNKQDVLQDLRTGGLRSALDRGTGTYGLAVWGIDSRLASGYCGRKCSACRTVVW